MSGQAYGSRAFETFSLEFESLLSRAIPVKRLPDGRVFGPKQYFEMKQAEYVAQIEQVAPAIGQFLEEAGERLGLGLMPFNARGAQRKPGAPGGGNIIFTHGGGHLEARLHITLNAQPSDEQLDWINRRFQTALSVLPAWSADNTG